MVTSLVDWRRRPRHQRYRPPRQRRCDLHDDGGIHDPAVSAARRGVARVRLNHINTYVHVGTHWLERTVVVGCLVPQDRLSSKQGCKNLHAFV